MNFPTDGSLTSLKVSCNLFNVLGANAENAVLPKFDLMKGVPKVIQLMDLVEWGLGMRLSIELM